MISQKRLTQYNSFLLLEICIHNFNSNHLKYIIRSCFTIMCIIIDILQKKFKGWIYDFTKAFDTIQQLSITMNLYTLIVYVSLENIHLTYKLLTGIYYFYATKVAFLLKSAIVNE